MDWTSDGQDYFIVKLFKEEKQINKNSKYILRTFSRP